jgi:BioD-like phosphotransacetylase family protein
MQPIQAFRQRLKTNIEMAATLELKTAQLVSENEKSDMDTLASIEEALARLKQFALEQKKTVATLHSALRSLHREHTQLVAQIIGETSKANVWNVNEFSDERLITSPFEIYAAEDASAQ